MTTVMELETFLNSIAQDYSLPRNVKRAADEIRKILQDESRPIDLKKADALEILDNLANDPNVPLHARTAIWNIIGAVEALA
ncbi:MAG: UPF0147 family protein [Candidatus Thermoplasmatota archaeon]|nr:UPF0147 family protein [Candidatus Thermoplasmatota archaeon]